MSETRRTLTLPQACKIAGLPEPRNVIGHLFVCHFQTENDDRVNIAQGGPIHHQNSLMGTVLGLEYNECFSELVVTTTITSSGRNPFKSVIYYLGQRKWVVELELTQNAETFDEEIDASFEILG